MKTLQEIKDEVARKYQCYSWKELCDLSKGNIKTLLYYNDVVTLIFSHEVAKQALINADKRVGNFPNYRNLVTDKILNESNIPDL